MALLNRPWPVRPAAVMCTLMAVSLTGCTQPTDPAGSVAGRFESAIAGSDWGAACVVLAPETKAELEQSSGKSCPAALEEEDLPDPGSRRAASVFGTAAQIRFARDTLFLARFRTGWKLTAAGCSPVPGHPYDCQLQGG